MMQWTHSCCSNHVDVRCVTGSGQMRHLGDVVVGMLTKTSKETTVKASDSFIKGFSMTLPRNFSSFFYVKHSSS